MNSPLPLPPLALQLRSTIDAAGRLEVSLVDVDVPQPGDHEVVIRIEATPINPSDLGLLFGPADIGAANVTGTPDRPVLTARVPEAALKGIAGRVGQSMPVGNEGAGTVVAAGSSPAAQAMLGRTVAALGGGMYTQYRCVHVDQCLLLPEGTAAADGASSFVNPLTALGMVETMRREGHRALVHTAAASNLGQMLNRTCIEDGVGLVNIVRKPAQATLLREIGAVHVCSTDSPDFMQELTEAVAATGATLAFDAIGGGRLAGQILTCMEAAASRGATEYSRYGSEVAKQVYIYGGLDTGPTEIVRNFGMTWGMGGWLLFQFLKSTDPDTVRALKARVAAGLTTTFASRYQRTLSLAQALQRDAIDAYATRSTGAKFLIDPSRT